MRLLTISAIAVAIVVFGVPVAAQEQKLSASSPAADSQSNTAESRQLLMKECDLLRASGKMKEAIALARKLLKLEREVFKNSSTELLPTLRWISETCLLAQQIEDAIKTSEESLRINDEAFGKDHWKTVSARWYLDYLRLLGQTQPERLNAMLSIEAEFNQLISHERYPDAVKKIEELEAIELEVLGKDHPFYANSLSSRAQTLLKAGNAATAFAAATQALDVRRRQLGMAHPDTAMACRVVSETLTAQGKLAAAVPSLQLAADVFIAAGRPEDTAWVQLQQGRTHAALKQDHKARSILMLAQREFEKYENEDGLNQIEELLASLSQSVVEFKERGADITSIDSAEPTARLHLLIIADTSDPQIGPSVARDLESVDGKFRDQVPNDVLHETVLKAGDVSPDQVTATIKQMEIRPEKDTVVIYYAGHGQFDLQSNDHILKMNLGSLSRRELKKLITDRKPRLTVIISDSCASFRQETAMVAAPFPLGQLSPLFHSLFFQPFGVVDINAARPGEVALGTSNGGVFTNALCSVFDAYKSDRQTWNDIIRNTNEAVKNDLGNDNATPRASQTAHISSTPEYPKYTGRLGVVAQRTEKSAKFDGVEVLTVFPGSPASLVTDSSGRIFTLSPERDVITHVNGEPVSSNADLIKVVLGATGTTLNLKVVDLTTEMSAEYTAVLPAESHK